jgi:ABC-2 type transport system ATP-binding protein
MRPAEAMERAHEAMFYVGLGEARYRPVGTFSTGMKQLVKLAQALVHGPRLLFLDEPTNGLDPPARLRMLKLVREIASSGNVHIILSSHLLRDVEQCCDEVLILRQGEVAVYCNLEEERRSNRKFIEMETLESPDAFIGAIEKLGCEVALHKGRIKTVLPEHLEVRNLYEAAASTGARIRRLDYKRDSLQDIFLKAMEGERNGSL